MDISILWFSKFVTNVQHLFWLFFNKWLKSCIPITLFRAFLVVQFRAGSYLSGAACSSCISKINGIIESSNSMFCYKNQNCVFISTSVPRIRIQWAKISTKYYKKKLKTQIWTVEKKLSFQFFFLFLNGSSSFSIKISEKKKKIIWNSSFVQQSVNLKEMFMNWARIRIPIKNQWTLSTIECFANISKIVFQSLIYNYQTSNSTQKLMIRGV